MQAYKLTGKINHSGQLILTEPTNLNPGDVEVIILQSDTTTENQLSDDQLDTAKFDKILTRPFPGIDEGRFVVPDDFDEPLPPDILKSCYSRYQVQFIQPQYYLVIMMIIVKRSLQHISLLLERSRFNNYNRLQTKI